MTRAELLTQLEHERAVVADNARTYRAGALGVRCDDFGAYDLKQARRRASAAVRFNGQRRWRYCPDCARGWTETPSTGRLCQSCGLLGEVA